MLGTNERHDPRTSGGHGGWRATARRTVQRARDLRLISSHELTAHLIQVIRTHLASIDDAFVASCPMSTRFGFLAILAQGADRRPGLRRLRWMQRRDGGQEAVRRALGYKAAPATALD